MKKSYVNLVWFVSSWQGFDLLCQYLVRPDRRFIREGALFKINRKKRAEKYIFILFNDILIYAALHSANKLKVYQIIHLSLAQLLDFPDGKIVNDAGKPIVNAFQVFANHDSKSSGI